MQRDLLKARMGKLSAAEAEAGLNAQADALVEDDEEAEELDSFGALPSTSSYKPRRKTVSALAPVSAQAYFDDALEVDTGSATFRVYYSAPQPHAAQGKRKTGATDVPVFSDLTSGPGRAPWAAVTPTDDEDDDDDVASSSNGIVFVCVHGAGYSALSFACLAKDLRARSHGRAGVLAFDGRGHGKTVMKKQEGGAEAKEEFPATVEMSLESLTGDFVSLLKRMYPERSKCPSFVLVGHSMGGSVVTSACNLIQKEVGNVVGVAVLDVVEGTALEALPNMMQIVSAVPKHFDSVEAAIEWHLKTHTLNNQESARVSVPPLLVKGHTEGQVVWRANLVATEPYWAGWFHGLSKRFLDCRAAKLLILAGTERLDKELMIGQMQGKYQLNVVSDSGHCIQEDAPEKTSQILWEFYRRNDRTDVLKGVKKVGEA